MSRRAHDELRGPVLLLISGDPGTGKSTLAHRCKRELGLALLSRDTIKELMFDTLGWSDRVWSKKVGSASFDLLFYFLGILLESRASVILDCNLSSEHARKSLRGLLSNGVHEVVEVVCTADPDLAFNRFRQRAGTDTRHPGHDDGDNLDEFRARIGSHPSEPVMPGSRFLLVDTGAGSEMELSQQICELVRQSK